MTDLVSTAWLAGQLGTGPDFLAPLDDADLDLWEGGR